jgi:hypothetical protein
MNLTAKLLFEQIRLPMGSKWPLSGKLRHSIATLDQWPLRAVRVIRVIRQQRLIVTDAAPCTFIHEERRAAFRCLCENAFAIGKDWRRCWRVSKIYRHFYATKGKVSLAILIAASASFTRPAANNDACQIVKLPIACLFIGSTPTPRSARF